MSEYPEQAPDQGLDTGLIALVMVARYHQVAADPDQIKHHFGTRGQPFSENDLVRAARHLGLKARAFGADWARLSKVALPAIAQAGDGNYFIVAALAEDKALIQKPGESQASTLSCEELEALWSGRLLLVTRRSRLSGTAQAFNIAWFARALAKYRRLLTDVIVASFFVQLFGLITPLFFQVVIDKVLVHKSLDTLDVLAIGLLVISVFDVVLNGLRNYVFSHTTNRVDVTLGAQLYDHLVHLPLPYFIARRVGTTVARVHELDSIRNFITSSALTLVIDLFFTIVFFAVMCLYSLKLTLIVAGSIPCYILLSAFVTPVLRRRLDEKFMRGAESQAFLTESVAGIETVKAMAVEPQMQRRWEERLAAYVSAAFKANNLGNVAGQTAQLINKVVTVLILWIGARAVIHNDLSVGELIAFNMIAGRVSAPILRLVHLWQDFQQARISVARLGDILNTPREPGHNPNRTTLSEVEGHVRLDQVTFRYGPDQPPVLKGLSIDVAPGEVIGIVGRSGSGKSTLTKLIQRLYLPETGRVMVDGIDLAQMAPAWLRRQVGVVLQENRLFNASIRDNIALADPGLPMDAVIRAARLAGAHEFIVQLPEGYDTMVGEQGASLSGGQRQRIAIARALISNPRILILDEATSALDYESERIIQDNMRAICQNRTVFIIAHRLSTVREADRILVMDQGQVVEQGDHHDLLRQNGYYAKLHHYQSDVPPIRARGRGTPEPVGQTQGGLI